jgi:dUTP pyrophosphatase
MVNLINHDPLVPAKIVRGDRIAQLIVQRVCRAEFQLVTELSESVRGIGGHGSTGGHAAVDRVSGAVPERAMEGTA